MLLVVDIGNSNIVFGIYYDSRWKKIWRIQSDPEKTADEYEVIFRSLFLSAEVNAEQIKKIVISSVVPALTGAFADMIHHFLGKQAVVVGPGLFHKLPIKILNPYEIGADLVANAIAGVTFHKLPCMIVDFGTALTFTTIGASGEILGVAIAPGLRTAVRSLASNTAQLPHVQLTAPPSVLGTNTVHAIQSGIVFGYCGLVNSLVERTEQELGTTLNVIATGGLASVLAPLAQSIHHVEENLTLDGLKTIAELVNQ